MNTRFLRMSRSARRATRPARRPLLEPLEPRTLLAVITVDSTADANPPNTALTLREAIEISNGTLAVSSLSSQQQAQVSGTLLTAAPGNTINFNIPGSGVQTINIASELPAITVPVTIDGYSQPGSSPNTLAKGDNAVLLIELSRGTQSIDGLTINAGDSTVEGLVIDGNVAFSTGAIVISNEGGNRIEGNFLGPDPEGTASPETDGQSLQINSGDNTIGGTTPAARNVLSVNESFGVEIQGSAASGNLVQGNYIGTNPAGTALLYGGSNVIMLSAPNNTIGGTTPGAGNVIAYDQIGDGAVEIRYTGSTGNLVQGNFIGVDATGTAALGTESGSYGVAVIGAPENTIGGTASGAGNVISGLGAGNGSVGIVISDINEGGLNVASNNLVQGNYIGTDSSGMTALPNSVGMELGGTGDTIGGTTPGAGNIISGNSDDLIGVGIEETGAQDVVEGNSIGVNAAGAPLGNSGVGVLLSSAGTTVGGTTAGAGNVIANNGGIGVSVAAEATFVDNAILSNDIYANGSLGISLGGGNGVTLNTPGGPHTGPNDLQNFPVITSVTSSGSSTTITGTLNSTPDQSFLIQFFNNDAPDPSSFGQGQTYIGSIQTALTDVNTGDVSFTATLPVAVSPTQFVTATATDLDGNTSEFSKIDADLSVSEHASASTVPVGQDVTFTATVTNAGPFAAPGIVVSDPLPAGFSFVSATSGATPQKGALSIPVSTLPVGSSTTVTVVLQATTAGGPFTNSMSVASAVIDPNTTNNTSTASVNVTQSSADLSVHVTAPSAPVQVGQDLTYTITASNAGPSPATGVRLTDTLPPGTTFISATGGATPSNGVLTFALGSLSVGASSTVTVVVQPTAAGTALDSATVTSDQSDPNSANNTGSAQADVEAPPSADLSVDLTATPGPVKIGQDVTYTITANNAGPSVVNDAVLTDTLPAGATFVSATGGATPSNGKLTFAIGFLDIDESSTVTVVVQPTTGGTLRDSAAVSSEVSDPDTENNTATVMTTVVQPTGLTGPTVLSVQRFGFHSLPTSFVLTFNGPLDPARASDPASYQLVDLAHPQRRLSFQSATYDPANQSVTLQPIHRLYLYDDYRLTVDSPGSMAASGSGATGGDFVTTVTLANLVLTSAQRRDGALMALIRRLAVKFPGFAHLADGPGSRPSA